MVRKKEADKKNSPKKTKGERKEKKSEEICEVFDVEKGKEKKEIISCGEENIPEVNKKQKESQNKLLRNILIGLGILIIIFAGIVLFINNLNNINYDGLEFQKVKSGNIMFYETQFPAFINNGWYTYDLFIRTNPPLLNKVPFEGDAINLKSIMVINRTEEFNCDGKGVIAMDNLIRMLNALEIDIVRDPNATCDTTGRYTFLEIESGDKTKIIENTPNCYTIQINNCEILEGTEKFMVEKLAEMKRDSAEHQ